MGALRSDRQGFGLHTALDFLMIALAIFLLFGWIQLPQINFLYSLALAIAGVFLLAAPVSVVRHAGLAAMLLGTYLVLRDAGIFSGQLLLYGLCGFLFFAGLVGILRDAIASSEPATETEEKGL